MDPETKLWYFENFNLLESLSPEEKKFLSDRSDHFSSSKEEVLYFPEDSSNKVFFLKEGKVKIAKMNEEGKEFIIAFLGPGEVFGELGLAGQERREFYAEATKDISYCVTPIEEFKSLIENNPKFNFKLTKLIGLRLKKVQKRLESLCFKSAPDRIREFIHELAEEHGRDVGYEKEVKLDLTHQNIADLTATSRQTVTTVLNDLEKQDLITFDRKRILIRDMDKLVP